jgi:hypothetical protein
MLMVFIKFFGIDSLGRKEGVWTMTVSYEAGKKSKKLDSFFTEESEDR